MAAVKAALKQDFVSEKREIGGKSFKNYRPDDKRPRSAMFAEALALANTA